MQGEHKQNQCVKAVFDTHLFIVLLLPRLFVLCMLFACACACFVHYFVACLQMIPPLP